MSRQADTQRVLDSGIVAIIRAPSNEQLVQVARTLYEAGIDVQEVTLTVPGALDVIASIRKELADRVL